MSSTMRTVPAAHFDNLVTTESGSDLLVYDKQTHHIHHLNATTAAVWLACDGQRTVDGIAIASGMPIEAVQVALTQLADAQLLDGPLDSAVLPGGQSRRRFLKRAAAAGAVAAPTLVSVTAPQAAVAESTIPRTQTLTIANRGNCLVTGSVAGYPVGYQVPFVIAIWRFNTSSWSLIDNPSYTFTVRSDGTGSMSAIIGNQAGRDDLATEIYIDSIKLHDFTPMTC